MRFIVVFWMQLVGYFFKIKEEEEEDEVENMKVIVVTEYVEDIKDKIRD